MVKAEAKKNQRSNSFGGQECVPVITTATSLCETLALQDCESLLQSRYFLFATPLSLLVRLRFRDATFFQLAVVLVYTRQLSVCCFEIRRQLSNIFVQSFKLLSLVLHILLQGRGCNLVLFRRLLVSIGSTSFLCLLLGKIAGEIRLTHLQDAYDAAGRSASLLMPL